MTTYNGHESWEDWNVALWLFNDEPLYRLVLRFVRTETSIDKAARQIVDTLRAGGDHKTPDGAPYTEASVREAIRDTWNEENPDMKDEE